MAHQWIKTKYPGIRYRKHRTRKHGVAFDQYYAIRYQTGGARHEEALGWASEGVTLEKAISALADLKNAARTGSGEQRLSEKRQVEEIKRAKAKQQQDDEVRLRTTFGDFFETIYLPQCRLDKKPQTATTEELLFRNWLKPVIGDLLFDEISIDHLNRIKANMTDGIRPEGKAHPRDKSDKAKGAHLKRNKQKPMSARSINYALAVLRQTWNRACASKPPLAHGEWPGYTKVFKKPKADNRRGRFLTRNEAAALLTALKIKSEDTRDMALLSLHCGLRAKEVFSLTWDKVNLKKQEITLVDTKNGETRSGYLTDEATAMLRKRSINCAHPRIIFPVIKKNGDVELRKQVPATFPRTVEELGLNDGIVDDRDKIVFHTLRHTYASWLVENGVNLATVRDLLGHKNLIMTSRYSHVSAEAQKEAVKKLNQTMTPSGDNVVPLHNNQIND